MSQRKKKKQSLGYRLFRRFEIPIGAVLLMLPAILLFFKFPGDGTVTYVSSDDETEGKTPVLCLRCTDDGEKMPSYKRGSQITIQIHPSKENPFFSAVVKHSQSDAVVTAFPDAAAQKNKQLKTTVDMKFTLDGTLETGKYDVFGIYSKHPQPLDAIKKLLETRFHFYTDESIIKEFQLMDQTFIVF